MKKIQEQVADLLCNGFSEHHTSAVILAAGNSTRMGDGINKQFALVNGAPVLAWTISAYEKCPLIKEIILVAREVDFQAIKDLIKTYRFSKVHALVKGGKTRQESAKNGFSSISSDCRYVAVADGARCLVTSEQITKVCLASYRHQAASAGHLISDTVKRATLLGAVTETVDRNGLWGVQTPQIFHTTLYAAALAKAEADGFDCTDDNSLAEHLGYQVYLVECGQENLKITTKDDLELASAILAYRGGNL